MLAYSMDIIYMNCQSFLANKTNIIVNIFSYKPSVVVLTESRITKDIEETEIGIKEYNVIRCDSNSRYTGGVMIYIRRGIEYTVKKANDIRRKLLDSVCFGQSREAKVAHWWSVPFS
ncbi:hypothetical protein JTB14_027355 [Gonioctena quinquepunctata]|nr:hypothetical protein JTB14_027355 [Gonioctena quinquepunctata]